MRRRDKVESNNDDMYGNREEVGNDHDHDKSVSDKSRDGDCEI